MALKNCSYLSDIDFEGLKYRKLFLIDEHNLKAETLKYRLESPFFYSFLQKKRNPYKGKNILQ